MLNKRISTGVLALSVLAMSLPVTNIANASEAVNRGNVIVDINGHWSEKELLYYYNKGMLTAYSDNTLKPNKTVTRAEFITFTNRVMGYNSMPITAKVTFRDVKQDAWYIDDLTRAIQVGYIDSKAANFRPDDAITRQEAAVIITNIFNNKDANIDKLAEFKDGDRVADWAKSSMEGAIESGYFKGTALKEIKPTSKLTRSEMATIFYRAEINPTDINGHWAENEMMYYAKKGNLTVYPDNTIRPNKTVTRAEFITFTNRVLGYDKLPADKALHFKDVKSNDWFAEDVSRAVRAGYINGDATNFRPNDAITRQEAAVILTNIFNNKDTNLDKIVEFKDADKIADWAKTSMEGAVEAGYFKGDKSKKINPTGKVTRGEMATIFYRSEKEPTDINGHWAEKAMEYFSKKGMLMTYDDNTFRPNKTVTRAEFITFTNRVFGYDKLPADKMISFKDVKSNDWFAEDVSRAVRAGYINGDATNFRPNDVITRQEMAVILTNILDTKDTELDKIAKFKDANKVADWAKISMEGAIEEDYLIKFNSNKIDPTGKVTRGEMATTLYKVTQ